jgi:hypothetical protein
MPDYVRANKQLLVGILGIATSLLTGIILGLIEAYTGFALYSLMVCFIIPFGAFIAGLGAASGYYAGAMWLNQKPIGGVLFNMISASVSAFFVVHFVPYFLLEVDGIRVKDAISFWRYLDFDIRHTSLSLAHVPSATTGELGGFWGYIYACLQLAGFSVGGFGVFNWLSSNPYCKKCSRYLRKTAQQDRFTSDGESLSEAIKQFALLLNNRKFNDAISFHAEKMGVQCSSGHHLRTRLLRKECQGCGLNHLDFIASQLDGKNWKDIEGTQISLFTEVKLNALAQ